MENSLKALNEKLTGELHWSAKLRALYATDGSIYRQLPLAVAIPQTQEDIGLLIIFARTHNIGLIPRTAGTSLAGQCVGEGIVVDTSKYFNKIIEINETERWARVQPGVIRDELNHVLKPAGLMFGPNTSTSNRAMIGGMAGNNSCGSTSVAFGTTRDHVLEMKGFLSDGSAFHAKPLSAEEFYQKTHQDNLEGKIYRHLAEKLTDTQVREEIIREFPKESINRRNTGYAVDVLLRSEVFTQGGEAFNLSKILCGSEGTLAFTTELKVNLVPVPPPCDALVCAHFDSIHKAMDATVEVMKLKPFACELMDDNILKCTYGTPSFTPLRSFVVGEPAAILIIEQRAETTEKAELLAREIVSVLEKNNLSYANIILHGKEAAKAWALRAAGLGLLANLEGDEAINCIEDTAVDVEDLPAYIREFEQMMHGYGQDPVYYAHAGDGELHLKPKINLATKSGIDLFKKITRSSAELVKKFKGSLSGEHGDGRVRAEYIPLMIGQKNYQLIREIKHTWDPQNIFNPGKIVDAFPIDTDLRHQVKHHSTTLNTAFDFGNENGFFKTAEKCTGSGDCRKLPFAGGTMCPSYQATLDEQHSTRGRANALREFISQRPDGKGIEHPELAEVMDLCIQCKGCTTECPSNVDMSRLKSEYQYQVQKLNGPSFRSRIFANNDIINARLRPMAGITNFILNKSPLSNIIKRMLGIAPQRTFPLVYKKGLRQWFKDYKQEINGEPKGKVIFFCDEFTDLYDAYIGRKAVKLLNRLGVFVIMLPNKPSGRSQVSKGFLNEARKLADFNVQLLSEDRLKDIPITGIEPGAMLIFRDEYPDLVSTQNKKKATELAKRVFLIEEYLYDLLCNGNVDTSGWKAFSSKIMYHAHCHQKSLSDAGKAAWLLSAAPGAQVEIIPSGCCGMAGSFGYEKEHYQISMKIGSLVLFPAINKQTDDVVIAASGDSCRHQIKDGTGRQAVHPVEILYEYAGG